MRDAEPRLKLHTVLIPDGLPIVREGLATLINRRSDMRVVARGGEWAREAVEKFIAHSPNMALFELRLPPMDGVEVEDSNQGVALKSRTKLSDARKGNGAVTTQDLRDSEAQRCNTENVPIAFESWTFRPTNTALPRLKGSATMPNPSKR